MGCASDFQDGRSIKISADYGGIRGRNTWNWKAAGYNGGSAVKKPNLRCQLRWQGGITYER
jgi:hypothetical protein